MGKDVIVTCDFSSAEQTYGILDRFTAWKPFVKICMEMIYTEEPENIRRIKSRNHRIFLDLKMSDIPNIVKKVMTVHIVDLHAERPPPL